MLPDCRPRRSGPTAGRESRPARNNPAYLREKYKKSVDRSFDGKIINNPVSEDIFQITDADILNDVRLQLISSIYSRNNISSYNSLKNNLSDKIWGISTLGIPIINTMVNGYE